MQSHRRKRHSPKHLAPRKPHRVQNIQSGCHEHLRSLTAIILILAISSSVMILIAAGRHTKKTETNTPTIITDITPKTEPDTNDEANETITKYEVINLKYASSGAPIEALILDQSLLSTLVSYSAKPEVIYDENWTPKTREEAEAHFIMDLDWVKRNIYLWYTEEEIFQTTIVVQFESQGIGSKTESAACVWVILSRVGTPGFEQNHSIIGILSAKSQFSVYTPENLAKPQTPWVRELVIDVMARFVLEEHGAPEEVVGRVMPRSHLFWHANDDYSHNIFYRYCWGDSYDPHDSPFNPYDT